MVSPCNNQVVSGSSVLLALMCTCVLGCGEIPMDNRGESRNEDRHVDAELASTTYLLGPEDYEKFQPGKSKGDILEDVQWRGNFEMATEFKGNSISAISYGVFGGPFSGGGDIVWAIFVDDKFQKFVEWPEWGEGPIKIGDFRRLIRAAESEPLSIAELKKKINAEPAPPSQTDPDLTAIWLLFRGRIQAARKEDVKRNAELRNQFNAARLQIGMAEEEVESVLNAKPIAIGQVETATFKIYGSAESFDVDRYVHYSNILVVVRGGKVSGIYSGYTVPGGERSRQELTKSFVDTAFSKPNRDDGSSDQ